MRIHYHDDIVHVPYCSVLTCINGDPGEMHNLITGLVNARLSTLRVYREENPALQVAHTVVGYLKERVSDPDLILDVPTFAYQPENLSETDIRENILMLCAEGKFVPFIVELNKEDIDMFVNHVHVIVAGIGENPDINMLVMVLNIPGIVKKFALNITAEEDSESMVQLIYPIVFDAINMSFGSAMERDLVSIQYCTMAENEEQSAE